MTYGKVSFKAEASAAFVINLLRIRQISVYKIKSENGFCLFSVGGADAEKVKEILQERGKDFRIVKSSFYKDRIRLLIEKAGILAAIAVWIVLAVVWSELLTEIRVSGCEKIEEEEIRQAVLKEIPLPTWKKEVDRKQTERSLIAMDGVANASVQITGNVMQIHILEELEKPKPIDYSEKKDVISAYDGVITGILVFSGEAQKKVGDTVKKGDVLISSTQTDADGNVTDIRATGSVYGRVWISKEYVFHEYILRTVRTGRTKTYVVGNAYKKEIDCGFSTFEKEEIPIGNRGIYKKIVFYETETIREKFDYEGNKEKIVSDKTKEIENGIGADAIKTRTWFSEKTVDKTTHLVIYYEIVVNLIQTE